jgi:hypothetical protein
MSIVLVCGTMAAQPTHFARLAQAAYDKGAYAEAAPLFLLASQIEKNDAADLYSAACCYALSGQKDLAFYSLSVAIKKGWTNKQHTESDEDLANLRSDPRWKKALEELPEVPEYQDNRDAVINDLNNLAAYAYQYRIRPSSMGGGEGSYAGFKIPEKMLTNKNASYETSIVEPNLVRYKATSARGFGTVETSINQDGRLLDWKYGGKFAEPPKENPTNTIGANKDALINHLNNIAAFCYQYRIRPSSMGGGQGSYSGVKLPEKLASSDEGNFSLIEVQADLVKIRADSKKVNGSITVSLDANGRMADWTYFSDLM